MASEAIEYPTKQYHLQEGALHFYLRPVISEPEKDFWMHLSSKQNKGKSQVGTDHFQTALRDYQGKGTDVWVAFISNFTIPDDGLINQSASDRCAQYGFQKHIEMMVSVITSANAPFSTHRGIMRTEHTYEGEKHPKISGQLHSFASKAIATHYPDAKPYMLFVPTPIMRDILHKALDDAGMLDRFHICHKENGKWTGIMYDRYEDYEKATLEEATADYHKLPSLGAITPWDYNTIFRYHLKQQEAAIASGNKKTPPFELRKIVTEEICTDAEGEYTIKHTTHALKYCDTDREGFEVLEKDVAGFLLNDRCFALQPLCAVEQDALSNLAPLAGEIDCLSLET